MAADEQELAGGLVASVVRVGATVRRTAPPSAPFVHRLLELFEGRGWAHAPRFLGTDERGREVLSWIDGEVPWPSDRQHVVRRESSLRRVARLVREFHDLTAGTDLAADEEVVCHNDLSPRNTVYRAGGVGLRPIALIDWDRAAPGRRIHDVAHLCWQLTGLGRAGTLAEGAANSLAAIADAYRLHERTELVTEILGLQESCWRGIAAEADAGDPAMIRLRDRGGVDTVRREHRWTEEHRATLESRLR